METETALVDMQQVMRWNQLNFAIGSAMPTCILLWLAASAVSAPWVDRWKRKRAEARERCRLFLADAERSLAGLAAGHDGQEEREGLLLFDLNSLYSELSSRSTARYGLLSSAERLSLQTDVLLMAAPEFSFEYRRKTAERIARTYSCFRQDLEVMHLR